MSEMIQGRHTVTTEH